MFELSNLPPQIALGWWKQQAQAFNDLSFDLFLCMQVGFVIALAAEAAVPVRGLFGAWDQQTLSLFGASALFLISCAAVCLSSSFSCLVQ